MDRAMHPPPAGEEAYCTSAHTADSECLSPAARSRAPSRRPSTRGGELIQKGGVNDRSFVWEEEPIPYTSVQNQSTRNLACRMSLPELATHIGMLHRALAMAQ